MSRIIPMFLLTEWLVAAGEMSFSVKNGLFTSINVPDNLSLGYSHFYAEVLRVKKVALEIMKPLELVVIFDELFKGTNVTTPQPSIFVFSFIAEWQYARVHIQITTGH